MINTPKTSKPRLLVIAAFPLTLFIAYAVSVYIEAHSKNVEFEERVQGMTVYEVCQVAYEEFGINTAKEIGCQDNIEALTDIEGDIRE